MSGQLQAGTATSQVTAGMELAYKSRAVVVVLLLLAPEPRAMLDPASGSASDIENSPNRLGEEGSFSSDSAASSRADDVSLPTYSDVVSKEDDIRVSYTDDGTAEGSYAEVETTVKGTVLDSPQEHPDSQTASSKLGVGYVDTETTHGVGYGHHLHPFYYQGSGDSLRYSCALQGEWRPIVQNNGHQHEYGTGYGDNLGSNTVGYGHLEQPLSSAGHELQELHPPAVVPVVHGLKGNSGLLKLQQLHPPKVTVGHQSGQGQSGHKESYTVQGHIGFEGHQGYDGHHDLLHLGYDETQAHQEQHVPDGPQTQVGLKENEGPHLHQDVNAIQEQIIIKPNEIKLQGDQHKYTGLSGSFKLQEDDIFSPPPPPRGYPWSNHKPFSAPQLGLKGVQHKYKQKYRPHQVKAPLVIPLTPPSNKYNNFLNLYKHPSFQAQVNNLQASALLDQHQHHGDDLDLGSDFLSVQHAIGPGGSEPELLSCTASGHYQVQDAASVFPVSLPEHSSLQATAHSEDTPVTVEHADQTSTQSQNSPVAVASQESVPIHDARPIPPRGRSLPLPSINEDFMARLRPLHFKHTPGRTFRYTNIPLRAPPMMMQQSRPNVFPPPQRLERRADTESSSDIYKYYWPMYKFFLYS